MQIVPNNKYLFKCKLASNILCDFCAIKAEAHLCWECFYVHEYGEKYKLS